MAKLGPSGIESSVQHENTHIHTHQRWASRCPVVEGAGALPVAGSPQQLTYRSALRRGGQGARHGHSEA
eukprot:scaffold236354_cov18-Tisochrysis_lutea.AAC.1